MDRQEVRFTATTNGKEVTHIGKSVIYQPPIRYSGKGTKWFDDSQLIRKGGAA